MMRYKKTIMQFSLYYSLFLLPSIVAYLFWLWSGGNSMNTVYQVGFTNLSVLKIFMNNTMICLLMILSGKYIKVFSTLIFGYNALLFSYYVLISLEMYGVYFVVYQLIWYAPLEIFAIVASKLLSDRIVEVDRKSFWLVLLLIEMVLFISAYLEMLVI